MSELHPALKDSGIEPGTAAAFIAVADFYAKQKYSEKPKNSNHTMFGAWYGVQTAWCAMFVSYCLNHSGNGKTIAGAQTKKGFSLCSKGIAFFKKRKAWFPVGKAVPGDVAFFDWNHDHSPEHTGLIVKVDLKKKRVLTIEGNTGPKNLSNGGMVMKQWRNMSTVMGVGRPAFAGAVKPVEASKPVVAPVAPTTPVKPVEPVVAPFEVMKVGSKGATVKAAQKLLKVEADGIFGPVTEKAVKGFQINKDLPVSGMIDSDTWKALNV